MFIVINRLTIQPGAGDQLAERFAKSHGLEQTPGFLRFQLLEPAWSPGELNEQAYLSMTEWESREAFEAWLESDAFKQAHKGNDGSIFAGPPQVTGYRQRVQRITTEAGKATSPRADAKVALLKRLGFAALFWVVVLGLALGSGMAGCGESQATGASEPDVAEEAEAAAETIAFTDDAGRTITLTDPADRIVAGASFAVEMLMAIDHPPVLRPDVPERKVHPEAARSIPTLAIEHGAGPDAEAIAAAEPDLVILHVNFAPFAANLEQALGTPVALFEIKSVDDVSNKLDLFGRITGNTDAAAAAVAALARQLDAVEVDAMAAPPRVLALFGTPEAFFAYRGTSYLGSMIDRLGAANVAANVDSAPGMRSVAPLNLEQAIGRQPDVILVVPHGPPHAVMAYLGKHPAWSQIKAVRDGRVHILDESLFSSNPGPRAPQALRELRAMLHPDAE